MTHDKDEIIRNEILANAQKLFQQYGLRKTTMDEIAAACGKAKSTLYYYFKSKEEVFDAVIQLETINLRKYVKEKVEEKKDLVSKIRTYMIEFHREVVNKTNLYRVVKKENTAESVARKYFYQMLEYEKRYLIRIMEDGYDSGEYRGIAREDIPWMAELFFGAFYGAVIFIVDKEGFIDNEKLEKAADLFVPKLFS